MLNQPQFHMDPIQYGGAHYAEGGVPKNEMGFNDQLIRANFVRKVFAMVSVMLGESPLAIGPSLEGLWLYTSCSGVVAAMTAVPFIHQPTMQFVRYSQGGTVLYFAGL
jgi:hypothetical protein